MGKHYDFEENDCVFGEHLEGDDSGSISAREGCMGGGLVKVGGGRSTT